MRNRMRKFVVLVLLAVLIFAPQTVCAASNTVLDDSFNKWADGLPEGFGSYVYECDIEEDQGAVYFDLEEEGYGYIFCQITLEPDTTYQISSRVLAEGIAGASPAAHINIQSQLAEAGDVYDTAGEWTDLQLYVHTNKDENQTYMLCLGVGDAASLCTGEAWLDNIAVERVDSAPEGVQVFTLVGELSAGEEFEATRTSVGYAEKKNRVEFDKEEVSYDHIGTALFSVVCIYAVYAVLTGRWAGRLGRFLSGKMVLPCLFAAGLLLRVLVAWIDVGDVTDMPALKQWAVAAFENGLGDFYRQSGLSGYSPAYTYILYAAGMFRSWLGLSLDSNLFSLIIRLPAILADIAIAWFAYKLAKKHLEKHTAVLLAGVLLFAPALIVGSAGWGKLDSIFVLPAVAALYLLSQDKKIAASLLWAVSFMCKVQALMIAPVFLYVFLGDLFRKGTFKKALLQTVCSLPAIMGVYLLIAAPVAGGQSLLYWVAQSFQTINGNASVNAFNFMGLFGGDSAGATDKLLFFDYSTLGLLAIGIFIVTGAILYIKLRDKKQCFLLAAILSVGIFTFAYGMNEGHILLAVVCLYLAAIVANSRKLLFSATIFSAVGFLNIYTVYVFGMQPVYTELIVILSALTLCAFLHFSYILVDIFQGKKLGRAITVEPVEAVDYKERTLLAAGARLGENGPRGMGMKKKDYILLFVITAVYAVVAFLNLGSTQIPTEAETMTSKTRAVIELEEPQYVGQLKYYTGYCQGRFRLYYSADGIEYTEISSGMIDHQYKAMFRWEMVDINAEIQHIKIIVVSGELEFRELGVFHAENERLTLKSAYLVEDDVTADASFLIDEQDQIPETTSFLTEMYFDEIYHARTAYEYIEGIYPYETTHPPLGKSIVTVGIKLFGFNPFGWRFMGTLFGVLMLPVFYLFAKKLFRKTIYAASATILLAADFMHFSLTRIATIDSFSVFFILLMYFFMYLYREHNFHKEKLWKTLVPLGLCGLSFALGAATKWICLYAGAGLAILFFQTIYCRHKEYRYAVEQGMEPVVKNYRKKLALTLAFCVVVFILIPIGVYCLSYIPYENTATDGFGLKGIWENQKFMLTYHGKLVTTSLHPYQSNALTWPFTIRPVFFFRADGASADSAGVLWCMGNPLIWIGGLLLVLYLLGLRKRGSTSFKGLPFLSVAALMGYIPWLLVSREIFIYHYFAVVPFLILISVYALRHMAENYTRGKKILYTYVYLAVLLFIAFYPTNTGMVVSRVWLNLIRWYPTWPL